MEVVEILNFITIYDEPVENASKAIRELRC